MATGRRINECRAMKWRDIDWDRGVYTIGGAFDREIYRPYPKVKDRAGDEYPLTPALRAIVKKAKPKDRIVGPDVYVFQYLAQQSRWTHYLDNRVRKIFNEARDKAGVGAKLNVFGRHSFGWQLREAGASYDDIADMLGNSPQVAAKNYAGMKAKRKAEILKLVSRCVPEESDGSK